MITIIDGMPGAGKTQFALSHLLKKTEKEPRPVYYAGIPELKIEGWIELEQPADWIKVEDGAIILLDEAQKVYPLRKAGSDKPAHVSYLETHRHQGHDLYLITQDGTLLDIQCRKLCNQFFHLKRASGTSRVAVTEYAEFANHNDYHERQKAQSTSIWKHDKKIWSLYHSATIHTVQARIPKKLYLVPVLIVGVIALLYTVFSGFGEVEANTIPGDKKKTSLVLPGDEDNQVPDVIQAKINYFEQYRPRLRDKPETAPIYDGLRTVQSYPRLQCIHSEKHGCACYSQQATKIQVSQKRCLEFIKKGDTFDHSAPDNAYIIANQLPKEEEPDWKTIEGKNPYKESKEPGQLVLSAEPWYETRKLKYARHDRGSMTIDKVVSTD